MTPYTMVIGSRRYVGCRTCPLACPYQARHITKQPTYAFGDEPMENQEAQFDSSHPGVATNYTICIDHIDLAKETKNFRMHGELGTDPGIYYIWDGKQE